VSRKSDLLNSKSDLDLEYLEQQKLVSEYGNNRAGRRRAASEMRRRRKKKAKL
jgi:hypothetical protein